MSEVAIAWKARDGSDHREKTVISLFIENEDFQDDNVLLEDDGGKKVKKRKANAELTTLLSVIYALCLTVFGLLLPLAEALNDLWLETYSNGIFLVYIYTVGTVCVLYLLFYLIPMSIKKHQKAEQRRKEKLMKSLEMQQLKRDSSAKKQDQLATIMEHDYIPVLKKQNSQAIIHHRNSVSFTGSTTPFKQLRTSASAASFTSTYNSPDDGKERLESEKGAVNSAWMNVQHLSSMFGHAGTSFYIRFGVLVFGIGNMIYICMEIEYYLSPDPYHCNTSIFGWTFGLRFVFVLVETYFLFKVTQAHVSVQTSLGKLCFMHLIATNICIWFRTLVNETYFAVRQCSNDTLIGDGGTHQVDCINCSDHRRLLDAIGPYIYPFITEFSLIAVGILFVMFAQIDKKEVSYFVGCLKQILKQQRKSKATTDKIAKSGSAGELPAFSEILPEDSDAMMEQMTQGPLHSKHDGGGHMSLEKSHRGLFVGFILLACVFVAMISFISLFSNHPDTSQIIYFGIDITTYLSLITANVVVVYKLRKFPLLVKPRSVDDTLLLISMTGYIFIYVCILMAISHVHVNSDHASDSFAVVSLNFTASLLGSVLALLQAVVVIGSLRKFLDDRIDTKKDMPGREAITFLIVTNVTAWIYKAALFKDVDQSACETFFGIEVWVIIRNLTVPLLLFFHYHCSAIFASIWSSAYRSINLTPLRSITAEEDAVNGHVAQAAAQPKVNGAAGVRSNPSFYVGEDDEAEVSKF